MPTQPPPLENNFHTYFRNSRPWGGVGYYSQIRCIALSVLQTSKEFWEHMFTCDWCISIHFVCFCVSSFVACNCPVLGSDCLVFFETFCPIILILVSCKNKTMSASCLQQKLHSSSRFPSLFLSSLESFSVLFLLAKLGECVAL